MKFRQVLKLEKKKHNIMKDLAEQAKTLETLTRRQHKLAAELKEQTEALLNKESQPVDLQRFYKNRHPRHQWWFQREFGRRNPAPRKDSGDQEKSAANCAKLISNLLEVNKEIKRRLRRAKQMQESIGKVEN